MIRSLLSWCVVAICRPSACTLMPLAVFGRANTWNGFSSGSFQNVSAPFCPPSTAMSDAPSRERTEVHPQRLPPKRVRSESSAVFSRPVGTPFASAAHSLSRSFRFVGPAVRLLGRIVEGVSRNPGGMNENSPAFQRRDHRSVRQVPKGRLNGRASTILSRPFGTRFPFAVVPGVKTPGYSHSVPPGRWGLP